VSETGVERRQRTPKRPRRNAVLRWLLILAVAAAIFAAGVALGQALHDNPKPGITVTTVTTIRP
jgi:sorbitol-specific phosphotransferase system component IIC